MADLAALLKTAVKTAVTAIGTIAIDAVYHSVGITAYDPITDAQTEITLAVPVKAFKYKAREDADDNNATVEQFTRVLISAVDLGTVVPKESDYIVLEGTRYEIMKFSAMPANAGYIFQVRAP